MKIPFLQTSSEETGMLLCNLKVTDKNYWAIDITGLFCRYCIGETP
jgi:hypothetical protein